MSRASNVVLSCFLIGILQQTRATEAVAGTPCSFFGTQAICESNSCTWCVNDQFCVEVGEPFACKTFCCSCSDCENPPAGCVQGDANDCFDFCAGCTTEFNSGAVCVSSSCSSPTPLPTPTPKPDCSVFDEQDDCEAESFCGWCAIDRICVEVGEPFACKTFCCSCAGCANPPAGCVQGDAVDCFAFCDGCVTVFDSDGVCLAGSCVTPTPTPRLPDGAPCDESSDCTSGNCVEGLCTPTSTVAATSEGGIAFALVVLVAAGGIALLRRATQEGTKGT